MGLDVLQGEFEIAHTQINTKAHINYFTTYFVFFRPLHPFQSHIVDRERKIRGEVRAEWVQIMLEPELNLAVLVSGLRLKQTLSPSTLRFLCFSMIFQVGVAKNQWKFIVKVSRNETTILTKSDLLCDCNMLQAELELAFIANAPRFI